MPSYSFYVISFSAALSAKTGFAVLKWYALANADISAVILDLLSIFM